MASANQCVAKLELRCLTMSDPVAGLNFADFVEPPKVVKYDNVPFSLDFTRVYYNVLPRAWVE